MLIKTYGIKKKILSIWSKSGAILFKKYVWIGVHAHVSHQIEYSDLLYKFMMTKGYVMLK